MAAFSAVTMGIETCLLLGMAMEWQYIGHVTGYQQDRDSPLHGSRDHARTRLRHRGADLRIVIDTTSTGIFLGLEPFRGLSPLWCHLGFIALAWIRRPRNHFSSMPQIQSSLDLPNCCASRYQMESRHVRASSGQKDMGVVLSSTWLGDF